jgi:large subunit ribosomal protein L5
MEPQDAPVTPAEGEEKKSEKEARRTGAEGAPEKPAQREKAPKTPKAPKPPRQAGEGGGESKGKAAAAEPPKAYRDPPGYKPRVKLLYRDTVSKELRDEFAYRSPMQVPRLSKIIVSMGLGEAIVNKKLLDSATQELTQITGRKAVRTKAKKSIATFKVRKGMDVGAMVTLRGNAMYEFFDRLVNVAMPRIKDFRGANPNAFDGHGNYSLGVTEQIIFPEIDYDAIERVSGMNIAVVTTAQTDQEARSLLARLGMPFRK